MSSRGNSFLGTYREDPALEIAKGHIKGHTMVSKFGEDPGVPSTGEVTVWDKTSTLYVYPTSALILTLVSTDANDTSAGTGARTIRIDGLDANYVFQSETIILNGTTPVNTTNTYLRIYRMVILTAGSSEKALGVITADNSGTTYAQVIDGNNQTLMALYTVPAGYTAFLFHGKASTGQGKALTGSFVVRPLGGVFNMAHRFYVFENSYDYQFATPVRLEEKTDLEVRAVADSGTVSMAAAFEMVIVKNEYL